VFVLSAVGYDADSGKVERENVEVVFYTFGKGEKDQAKVKKLKKGAVQAVEGHTRLSNARTSAYGEEVFSRVPSSESKGLGIYNVGVRYMDRTAGIFKFRRGLDVGDAIAKLLVKVSEGVSG